MAPHLLDSMGRGQSRNLPPSCYHLVHGQTVRLCAGISKISSTMVDGVVDLYNKFPLTQFGHRAKFGRCVTGMWVYVGVPKLGSLGALPFAFGA